MTVEAAGGVLWRAADGALEVAIVHRPKYDDWSLPKGKLTRGEDWAEAAQREVAEETGHRATLGAGLGDIRYRVAAGDKVVRYWAMPATDGRFVPGREVDELRWVDPDAATSLLSYDRDREVLARFTAAAERPRWAFLLRHAAAGRGVDPPLNAAGRNQAAVLCEALASRPVAVVQSSPAQRCVETVEPLARRLGLPLVVASLLAEDEGDSQRAAHAVRGFGLGGQAAVACTHAPVAQGVVERLARADGLDPPVTAPPPLAGGFALRFEGLRLIAVAPVASGSMA